MCLYIKVYFLCAAKGCRNIVDALHDGNAIIDLCGKADPYDSRFPDHPHSCDGTFFPDDARDYAVERNMYSEDEYCAEHGGETWVKARPMTPELDELLEKREKQKILNSAEEQE